MPFLSLCFPSQHIPRDPCHAVLEGQETAPFKGSPGPCRPKAAAKEVLGADKVAQFSSDLITGLGLARETHSDHDFSSDAEWPLK